MVKSGGDVSECGGELLAMERNAAKRLGLQRTHERARRLVEGGVEGARARERHVAHGVDRRRLRAAEGSQIICVGHRHLSDGAVGEDGPDSLPSSVEGVSLGLKPRVSE